MRAVSSLEFHVGRRWRCLPRADAVEEGILLVSTASLSLLLALRLFGSSASTDLAQHFFVKANISAIRRVRKTDNNRIARVCGATIVSRTEELQESDVGTGCGLFEIRKFGDECVTTWSLHASAIGVVNVACTS